MAPSEFDDVSACVDRILDRLGDDITVAAPLGVGKPNHLLNELVERALADPSLDLTVWTALTLSKPDWDSDLERRLVEPLADRLFGDYPTLRYDELLRAGDLPENIEIHQFYFPPGDFLGNPDAQQHHHSVNYTHVARAIEEADVNLLVQLVGAGELDDEPVLNLGSNPDLTHEVLETLRQERADGEEAMVVGQVNRNMPFMYGAAPIERDAFDAVLDDPDYEFPLFGPPNLPISTADHAIALRTSALVKDGGTLQIGIGSLGDAIGAAIALRDRQNDRYTDIADALGIPEDCPDLLAEWGDLDPFDEGLYAASEMVVEAFVHLYEAGVLRRETYDDIHVQRLASEDLVPEGPSLAALDALVEWAAIDESLTAADVDYLREWGLLREAVEYDADDGNEDDGGDAGTLHVDGERFPADLADEAAREAIAAHALGDELSGGKVLHGGFFLGSQGFYDALREMDEADRRRFSMRSVQFTNQLGGQRDLARLQRRDARFVNTGMKATVTGGVVSDGLASNQVVSGVGGQFDFVDMAQELPDGRSIILVRATRETSDGGVESNIIWNYGHITIPRHMRDIVVTEYGVADLRDRSDAEVIQEMIKIADSRFQDDLVEQAKAAGKLPEDWTVPPAYRNNYPETIESALAPYQDDLPSFPFGTELTEEERALAEGLRTVQRQVAGLPRAVRSLATGERSLGAAAGSLGPLWKGLRVPDAAGPYLERMDLDRPTTRQERVYRHLVAYALAEVDAV
ncbi:acetyl-CoA hydrolase/transferase C-terminal domain-containing protein [Haloglomus litoreum]|uniref:acetyl-CoA hydrolase/transferase C-terminal domain-containing protein n=1 Tax=Haloglomus litoreum TaxID=3034026 RepID=UPI0023E7DC18|nr:acetyl-CoA hydrolase/transferase C-terminal domain-containing protein [Haloglomus sp. DT116]